jgi:hypothetical protein
MGIYQILFYLLIFVLAIDVLQGLGIGTLFFFKSTGEKRANAFYGLLLITFGLTLLHNIFVMTGLFHLYPWLSYLPSYFTLAFPVLLFYHVKLTLYPNYQFRSTDIKHFILPVLQFCFFIFMIFAAQSFSEPLKRNQANALFYGRYEQLFYLISFFAYLYFSWRYIQRKRREVRERKELKQIFYLRILVQTLFVLFCIHTFFVLSDFISYEFFDVNLRAFRAFAALGALSFAALLFWLGIYGFQVLFWGRRVFGKLGR